MREMGSGWGKGLRSAFLTGPSTSFAQCLSTAQDRVLLPGYGRRPAKAEDTPVSLWPWAMSQVPTRQEWPERLSPLSSCGATGLIREDGRGTARKSLSLQIAPLWENQCRCHCLPTLVAPLQQSLQSDSQNLASAPGVQWGWGHPCIPPLRPRRAWKGICWNDHAPHSAGTLGSLAACPSGPWATLLHTYC